MVHTLLTNEMKGMCMYHEIRQARSLLQKKSASHETMQAYMNDIRSFLAYLSSCNIYDKSAVTQQHVYGYFDQLRQAHVMRSTAERKATALQMFLDMCGISCHVPRPESKLHIFCYAKDIENLYTYLCHQENAYAYRDACMIMLQHHCGMSCHQLLHLRMKHITEYITTHKVGRTHLSRAFLQMLTTYQAIYAPHLCSSGDQAIAFAYLRRGAPQAMTFRIYTTRLKKHLSHVQQQQENITLGSHDVSDYDPILAHRYRIYHNRA